MPESDLSQSTTEIVETTVSRSEYRVRYCDKPLQIKQQAPPWDRRVSFSVHPETVKIAKFRGREKMCFVFDTDKGTRVGLRHTTSRGYPQFRDLSPGRSYFTITFNTKEMADAFIPPGALVYEPEVELDEESGTLWFPLPYSRSIHPLLPTFDHDWPDLSLFVSQWFSGRIAGVPGCWGFSWDSNSRWIKLYDAHDTDKVLGEVTLDVPHQLLQDPIRNGSAQKEHGFNPWNEDQKLQIMAHLESLIQGFVGPVTLPLTVAEFPNELTSADG